MKQLRIELYGRVQGVGFRNNIKIFADKLEINGFVMNRADGSVLIVAQGNGEQLEKLGNWIESSPGVSKVEDVKIRNEDIEEKFEDFRVIREESFLRDQKHSFRNLSKRILG